MARQVTVLVWCDLCDDKPVEGRTHTVEVDGLRREVDVCDDHWLATGLANVASLLEASGRKVEAPGRASHRGGRKPASGPPRPAPSGTGVRHGKPPANGRPYGCPWCSLDYATSASLLGHAVRVHGLPDERPGAGAVARLLGACPLCAANVGPGLDHHTRQAHGLTWSAALRQARLDGDSHGVVAALDRQAQQVEAVA